MQLGTRLAQRIQRTPAVIYVLVALLCVYGLTSSNPGLTVSAALLFLFLFVLLWRPGEPPILLLAFVFQWLQVVIKVLQADLYNRPVVALSQFGGDISGAISLSMFALAALVAGASLTIPAYNRQKADASAAQAMALSPRKLWYLYLLGLTGSIFVLYVGRIIPGFTQIALAAANAKWAIFFVLAYVCILRGNSRHLFAMAFLIEFALGVGSYFSDFKTVFFITILAYASAGKTFSIRQYLTMGLIAVVLIWVSLLWTAVKIEYRSYLSNGFEGQVVVRDYDERIVQLLDMVSGLDDGDMDRATRDLVSRISYIDIFARVVDSVPARIRHEDGEIWGGALRHIFMPRLFFPDKPVLRSDTEITQYYTGFIIPGSTSATSISMGYVADSYIDFGVPYMYIPIFMLGMLWGLLYRYFIKSAGSAHLIGYALSVIVLFNAMLFETGIVKLLGGVITSYLVALILLKLAQGLRITNMLQQKITAPHQVLRRGVFSVTKAGNA